jgi:chemotaxis protein methyltransferase CheR
MTLRAEDFGYVQQLVRRHSAIMLDDGKEYLVESRLSTLAASAGYGSLEELIAALRHRPVGDLHRKVIEAMTTNETTFFRDVHPFEALRVTIFPELIARNEARRQLSIWCAACSTGQEPYTIAMLVREHFPELLGWDLTILGTDLSGEVIDRARVGLYSGLEVGRGLPASYLGRFFHRQGAEWQIAEEVRGMVEFRELNLCDSWAGLPRMDLIFLRNVLIYFDVESKKEMLRKVRDVLHPHGHLFLGGAETTLNLDDAFERVSIGGAMCYSMAPGCAR